MRQRAKEIEQEISEYIDPVKREYLPNFSKRERGNMAKATSFWEW